ncbi:hypothetical protein RI367_000349 [Sorochytrium milnesiophthora]
MRFKLSLTPSKKSSSEKQKQADPSSASALPSAGTSTVVAVPVRQKIRASALNLEADIENSRTLADLCKTGRKDETCIRQRKLGSLDFPVDQHGNTALHLATFQRDLPLIYMLLVKGADPNLENNAQQTPLTVAAGLDFDDVQLLLLKHGATDKLGKARTDAAEAGSQVLLSPEELIMATQSLQSAAYRGLTWHVVSLTDSSNINQTDQSGCTLLMRAAKMGHLDLVNQLCQRQADVHVLDGSGLDALTWACLAGWKDIAERLIAAGASVNVADNAESPLRCSPLMAACYGGHTEVVNMLLDYGAAVNYTSQNGISAVMVASWMGFADIVQALIQQRAAVDTSYTKWYPAGAERKLRCATYYAHMEQAESGEDALLLDLVLGIEKQLADASPDKDTLGKAYVSSIPTKLAKKIAQEEVKHDQSPKEKKQLVLRTSRRGDKRQEALADETFSQQRWLQSLRVDQLGDYKDLVQPLFQLVPDKGSELERLFIDVVAAIAQLACLASKNDKQHYITTAAKAVDAISSTVSLLKAQNSGALLSPTGLPVKSPSRSSVTGGSSMSVQPDTSPFSLLNIGTLRPKLLAEARQVHDDKLATLLRHTRLASGVWPPPTAAQDMLQAACDVVRECKRLVDLGNLTGYWPRYMLSRDAILNEPGEGESKAAVMQMQNLSFADYKRQSDMKKMDELANQSRPKELVTSTPDLTGVESSDQEFFATIDRHTALFVATVRALKTSLTEAKKEEYVKRCAAVCSALDLAVDEIKPYHLFTDAPKHLRTRDGKATILGALNACTDAVETAGDDLLRKGELAAGVWPPPNAVQNLSAAMTGCAAAFKALTVTVKELCDIIRSDVDEEQLLRRQWRKQWLQGEKVKQLFQAWDMSQQDKARDHIVLTDDDRKLLADGNDGLLITVESGKPYIKGGRLAKLVERLTHHEYFDAQYNQDFILTHHSFTTSQGLLDMLIQRYDMTPPYGLDERSFELYISQKLFPVRTRILEVLRMWMKDAFADFFADEMAVMRKLKQFLGARVAADFPSISADMIKLLTDSINKTQAPNPASLPLPLSPSPNGPDAQAQHNDWIYQTSPEHVAQQLCFVEMMLFRNVEPKEFINQIWGRVSESSVRKAPNLDKLIGLTNRVTRWVAKCVLAGDTPKARMNAIKFFIGMAAESRRLNDFNGLTMISGGLSVGSVRRLEALWAGFDSKFPKLRQQYQPLEEAVSTSGQYANYRRILKAIERPAIPFLGVYITDLTFIEDGNPDFLPETHYINMDKRRKVAKIINEIKQYQASQYILEPDPSLVSFFSTVKTCEDSELFALSLRAEPLKDDDDDSDNE